MTVVDFPAMLRVISRMEVARDLRIFSIVLLSSQPTKMAFAEEKYRKFKNISNNIIQIFKKIVK
jgi:hypothetical protein